MTAAAVALPACSVDDLDLAGRSCPCVAGWSCDPTTHKCIPDDQAPLDAGTDGAGGADGAVDGGDCSTATAWWDDTYAFRRRIDVTAGSTDVPIRYSVAAELDHAAEVQASQSLDSGDDVRVVCTGYQVPRTADPHDSWNQPATRIWFDLPAGVAAEQSNDACYLYYGNPAATDPPNKWSDSMGYNLPAEIFLSGDDFERHDDGASPQGWTDQGTDDWQVRVHDEDKWFSPQALGDWQNGSVATSMPDVDDASWSAELYYWQAGDNGWGGLAARVEGDGGGAGGAAAAGGGVMVLIQDRRYYVATEYWLDPNTNWTDNDDIHFPHGSMGRLEIVTLGSAAAIYWHNPVGFSPRRVTIVEDWTLGAAAGKLAVFAERPFGTNQRWIDVDDIIVRRFISPEPAVSLGCEEHRGPER
jgi:hypothetical protein